MKEHLILIIWMRERILLAILQDCSLPLFLVEVFAFLDSSAGYVAQGPLASVGASSQTVVQ